METTFFERHVRPHHSTRSVKTVGVPWADIERPCVPSKMRVRYGTYLTPAFSCRTGRETGAVLRRYSLLIAGFVSLHAPLVEGELLTKPITFVGNQLSLNVSTSAARSVRIEIQNSGETKHAR